MRDTSPQIEARYHAMLAARSGEQRMRMADSMYAAARALVVASVLERDPSAAPAARRQAVFLRFYGDDFDPATRERILARLSSADAEEVRRARKRVAVDWDMLEMTLTWHDPEALCVLDLRTGEVRHCSRFGGSTEEFELSEDDLDAGEADGYFVRIEPIDSSLEYRWMEDFAATVADPPLRDRLERALDRSQPFRRFKHALGGHRAERERWFRFRDERVREAVRRWLEDHDIEATPRPPEVTSP